MCDEYYELGEPDYNDFQSYYLEPDGNQCPECSCTLKGEYPNYECPNCGWFYGAN